MAKRKKHPASLWKLSQKEKAGQKRAEDGYSDISYGDTWCMDETLAQIIAKHLRAFLKVIKESPYGGFPGELCDRYGHEQGAKEWNNILRKMIYAFEEYKRRPEIELNDDLEEDEIDGEAEREREALEAERQKRIKEGMQLFVDYFKDLWW